MLKDKFKIETLPITKNFLREKRYIEERGELVLLSDSDEIRHITYFSLNPGKDFFRGGHYHKKKTEKFYVVSGKLNVFIVDVNTQERDSVDLIAGQRMTIYPFLAHKFQAITESHVIEYYASIYDIDDDVRFTDF